MSPRMHGYRDLPMGFAYVDRVAKQIADDRVLKEYFEEWAVAVEVMLFKLHDELLQWPDEYMLFEHGSTDENPHVWFPIEKIWTRDNDRENQIRFLDAKCTCGLLKSEYDLRQMMPMVTLYGLIRRDVQ